MQEGDNLFAVSLLKKRPRQAFLVDSTGYYKHVWGKKGRKFAKSLESVSLLPNGQLLVVNQNRSLQLYTWESELVWERKGPGGRLSA